MAEVKVDWTPPAVFENGDPLDPVNDLTGYNLEYFEGNVNNKTSVILNGGNTMTHTLAGLQNGPLGFRVAAIGNNAAQAPFTAWSNIDASVPGVATGLTTTLL